MGCHRCSSWVCPIISSPPSIRTPGSSVNSCGNCKSIIHFTPLLHFRNVRNSPKMNSQQQKLLGMRMDSFTINSWWRILKLYTRWRIHIYMRVCVCVHTHIYIYIYVHVCIACGRFTFEHDQVSCYFHKNSLNYSFTEQKSCTWKMKDPFSTHSYAQYLINDSVLFLKSESLYLETFQWSNQFPTNKLDFSVRFELYLLSYAPRCKLLAWY